jgi:hypothetical protein
MDTTVKSVASEGMCKAFVEQNKTKALAAVMGFSQ